MTDYLELLEEKSMDALLEQTRRMERVLSGLRDWTAGEEVMASSAGSIQREMDEWENAQALESRGESMELLWTKGEVPPFLQAQGKAREKESFPLSDQLRQLDRAAELSAVGQRTQEGEGEGDWSRPWSGQRGIALLPGAARRTIPGDAASLSQSGSALSADPVGGEALASAGALSWAEQADRVFRRDSRRYDGGFYLY